MLRAAIVVLGCAGGAWAEMPAPISDTDYRPLDAAQVRLGWQLFYDPILSGNRNISCGTCHHPRFATSDGVSLSLGEGGIGLGPARTADPENLPEQRIPRNAPALFNLGAREFRVMFHDGRIEVDPTQPGGLRTPMGAEMVEGFATLLSAQTMFPVLSSDEMAGHYSENEISQAVRKGQITGPGGAWDLLSQRVAAVPDYAAGFEAAYPGREITFTAISDVIAAFVEAEWRSDTSPFDAHLRGQAPLTGAAAEGMALFYGEAGCAACHSGAFQTDHGFHAMAAPQIGPGKAARFETHARDLGRGRVTGRAEDMYAFRTPSLRNVVQTGPWGHAGAHRDLAAFLRDHGQEAAGYDLGQAVLPELPGAVDNWHLSRPEEEAALAAAAVQRPPLGDEQIVQLIAFLESLSDPAALAGRLGVPETVPSGLPVDR